MGTAEISREAKQQTFDPVDDAPKMDERDVACFYRMSLAGVRRMRANGRGPRFYKIGALVRYRLSDCVEFMERCAKGGKSDG